jgi:hypothetical protein
MGRIRNDCMAGKGSRSTYPEFLGTFYQYPMRRNRVNRERLSSNQRHLPLGARLVCDGKLAELAEAAFDLTLRPISVCRKRRVRAKFSAVPAHSW